MEEICFCNSVNNKEIYISGPEKEWEKVKLQRQAQVVMLPSVISETPYTSSGESLQVFPWRGMVHMIKNMIKSVF